MTTEEVSRFIKVGFNLESLGYANPHLWKHWNVDVSKIGNRREVYFTQKGESNAPVFDECCPANAGVKLPEKHYLRNCLPLHTTSRHQSFLTKISQKFPLPPL